MSVSEERVESLERQVRRQRRWNIALGALVVVGGLMAATAERSVPDVIQAKKFEVVNDEGKVHVRLGLSKSGEGEVEVLNKIGRTAFVAGVDSTGGGVIAAYEVGGTPIHLVNTADTGGGQIRLFCGTSKKRPMVTLRTVVGGGSVATWSKLGTMSAMMTTESDGGGGQLGTFGKGLELRWWSPEE